MRWLILVVLFLMLATGGFGESSLMDYCKEELKFNFLDFKIDVEKIKIKVYQDQGEEDKLILKKVIPEETKDSVRVLITDQGFEPRVIYIKEGQIVVWKNKQTQFNSMVAGVREIAAMKSPVLEPQDHFSWQFETEGKYDYIDAVLVGRTGKVIVE